MKTDHIRNFSIIAHIDHGKSTLADRMLEETRTIERRKMREQVLDAMDLERERGITIKMTPVRMQYGAYVLNMIDTPGHIDFAYEVSRALKAVEGVVLLVDSTQGVQAQTLSTLDIARKQGKVIIPVMTKIDAQIARPDEVRTELADLLSVAPDTVHAVSGKTGEGVAALLDVIVEKIPPPEVQAATDPQALVFDFEYSDHKGIILYVRAFAGEVAARSNLSLVAAQKSFTALEVGMFNPERVATDTLETGMIGYIVTGIKEPGVAFVGDTVIARGVNTPALPGYEKALPVVWASIYPQSQDDFTNLKQSLERLHLSDASLSFEEDASGVLGRGFRCGFLGMLHLEIVTERLRREFKLDLVATTPSVSYRVVEKDISRTIYSATRFPDHGQADAVFEPWVSGEIFARTNDIGAILQLLYEHEAEVGASETFGSSEKTKITFTMPLRELYRNFFDELKSVSAGFASLSYEPAGEREAHVVRLDVLVAGESVPALTHVVADTHVEKESRRIVERLREILPRQQFAVKIQAQAKGRIIASETLKASRKDVTGYLYGGDVTRKKKLLEKQKKGKKRMKEQGTVHIPHDTLMKLMRSKEK